MEKEQIDALLEELHGLRLSMGQIVTLLTNGKLQVHFVYDGDDPLPVAGTIGVIKD